MVAILICCLLQEQDFEVKKVALVYIFINLQGKLMVCLLDYLLYCICISEDEATRLLAGRSQHGYRLSRISKRKQCSDK